MDVHDTYSVSREIEVSRNSTEFKTASFLRDQTSADHLTKGCRLRAKNRSLTNLSCTVNPNCIPPFQKLKSAFFLFIYLFARIEWVHAEVSP